MLFFLYNAASAQRFDFFAKGVGAAAVGKSTGLKAVENPFGAKVGGFDFIRLVFQNRIFFGKRSPRTGNGIAVGRSH